MLETTVTSRSLKDADDPCCCTENTSPGPIHDDKFPIAKDPGAVGVTIASPKDVTYFNPA